MAFLAQWKEQWSSKPKVIGSNPIKRKEHGISNNISK